MRNYRASEEWSKGLTAWEGLNMEWDLKLPEFELVLPELDLKLPEFDLMAGWNSLDFDWKIIPVLYQPLDRAESLISLGFDGNINGENHYSISRD